ncbi:MAG: response regulator transcription factor [Flavobacteriales bacterium]|nr:response regulator transcription factor [Flavobacteriales bacterium]
MNAIIIENTKEEQNCLCKLIRLFCPNVTIIGCANTVEEGIHLIHSSDPDLVFVDSHIPNKDEINLIPEKSQRKFHTVFISDLNDKDAQVQKHNRLNYLLKPIHPDSLKECVKMVRQKLKAQLYPNYKSTSSQNKKGPFERIGIPTGNGVKYLALKSILYLRARDNYTEIILENAKPILISKSLKSFEELLLRTSFTRAHQSFLVNLKKVIELQRVDGGLLLLQNNHKIPISRSKKDLIKRKLNETWQLV